MRRAVRGPLDGFFDSCSVRYLVGNYNTCAADWKEIDCRYGYHKLYFFRGGRGTIVVDGRRYAPRNGDLYLIPAGTTHSYFHDPADPVVKYWCHFDLRLGKNKKLVFSEETVWCRPDEGTVTAAFQKILNRNATHPALHSLLEQIGIKELLFAFLQCVDHRRMLHTEHDEFSTTIERYILSRLHDEIQLEQLADIVHLQPNYFIQYCKKHTGMTPIELIHSLKLRLAADLMADKKGDMSIAEIAFEVGFKDYRYFSRLFKRTYGMVPSRFRDLHRVPR